MKINTTTRLHCIQQINSLLQAGIAITKSLELLASTESNLLLKKSLLQMRSDILAGNTITNSASKQRNLFTEFALALIQLGEQTGKINYSFQTIADQYESEVELRNNLIQNLLYPSVLLLTAVIMVVCMFCFVIPHFAELFASIDKPLPFLTRVIFSLSHIFRLICYYALLMISTTCLIILSTGYWARLQNIFLVNLKRAPLIRQHYYAVSMIHFSSNLSVAIEAGVPLLQALELATNTSNNSTLKHKLKQIQANVSNGVFLHQALQSSSIFPASFIQIIKTGEETGSLATMLLQAAKLMRINHRAQLKRLLQLLEPLIILGLGVLIGGLVVGMYLPIFNLGSAL